VRVMGGGERFEDARRRSETNEERGQRSRSSGDQAIQLMSTSLVWSSYFRSSFRYSLPEPEPLILFLIYLVTLSHYIFKALKLGSYFLSQKVRDTRPH
jgi:hypothetical protein